MEDQGKKILDEALLNAHVKTESQESVHILKQDQINEEIEWIDVLIDCRLIFIDTLKERYRVSRSKDDFVALKESITRLAEFMIIREKCF